MDKVVRITQYRRGSADPKNVAATYEATFKSMGAAMHYIDMKTIDMADHNPKLFSECDLRITIESVL